ncbi:MAG: hypothetical protein IPL12_00020 [Bacteroidetes bacterium]|nr:hypothetical protein [Bacteroidota bacterium]
MRHNICLTLVNLILLSTVSGQLFEDGYLSYFEQEPDSCRLIISKCFIGEDSIPSSIDTISYDSAGQRKSVAYRNNAFECADCLRIILMGM